uniref:GDP-L-fucose synthase family protein n=1 Tax=Algoriphagus sp. TaxID=1872435 RepID=UPI004047468B
MELTSKIYIAGHKGMVGSGLERKLRREGFTNIVTRTSSELDLRNQQAVNDFFKKEKPAYVILAAAKVGGIYANKTYRAEFIYDNLMIEANIIHAAYLNEVKKLLFLGSSCIYPKMALQPLKEEYLLSGYLETTNQPYAIAKIAGIELCDSYRSQFGCNFISAMPTNLYGTNDNYHPENSHVLPALIRKIVLAKQNNDPSVIIWGSGTPRREFLHVDDLADACFFLLKNYNEQGLVNVGSGKDISIKELAQLISSEVDYKGDFIFDNSKPDGAPRKLMDISKLSELGWSEKINFRDGIKKTIFEFFNL